MICSRPSSVQPAPKALPESLRTVAVPEEVVVVVVPPDVADGHGVGVAAGGERGGVRPGGRPA